MSDNLTIQGIHIQTLYAYYISKKFLINRKYQRKLAWTIEEKRNFIDTIIRGLPVPLFLLAEVEYEGDKRLEVIDGMQRLDTIFSLIEQKYSLKDGFFDLSVMADTLELMNIGEIEQRQPVLDFKVCKEIVNYLLPVSRSLSLSKIEIEETFRRINSNGKHLSNQELRQAGAIGNFPELVRQLSAELRGDISRDDLLLNDMSTISLTNKRLEYYGLDIYEVFWVKNHIMSIRSIRESRDEELIGHIIANIVLERKENFTSQTLDSYYGFTSNPLGETPLGKTKIENAIDRISIPVIKKQFNAVYSAIDNLLTKNNLTFRDLIYKSLDQYENWRAFHVIYMAFFDLLITRSKKIGDEGGLLRELSGIGDDLLNRRVVDTLYDYQCHQRAVNSIVGRIQNYFVIREVSDPAYDDWTREFTNILMTSKTEQNQYDYKIGLHDLKSGQYNEELIFNIIKTLTAINNLGPNKIGYVIIGLTDNEGASNAHEKQYNVKAIQVHNFYITGIEAEAQKYSKNVDIYMHKIIESIKQAPVEPKEYLQMLLTNIKSRTYYGKEIVVFKTEFNKPIWYEGKLFERHGSHSKAVNHEEYGNVYNRFFNY